MDVSRSGPIAAYLARLDAELLVPKRTRQRILGEVADHLLAAATEEAEGHGDGGHGDDSERAEAEQRAVERFGAAPELARQFGEELAAAGARRAWWRALLTLGGLAAVTAWFMRPPATTTHMAWPNDAAFGLVVAVAAQVAGVGGGISLVRWFRWRRHPRPPADASALLARGAAVVVAAAAAALAAMTGAELSRWDAVTGSNIGIALAVGTALGWVLTLASAGPALRELRRTAALAGDRSGGAEHPGGTAKAHAVDDLLGAWDELRTWCAAAIPRAGIVLGRLDEAVRPLGPAARRRFPRLATWADLRRHPWRCCAAVALLAGTASFLTGTFGHPLRGVTVGLGIATGVTEAAAIVAGFALLGGPLGLRRPIADQ